MPHPHEVHIPDATCVAPQALPDRVRKAVAQQIGRLYWPYKSKEVRVCQDRLAVIQGMVTTGEQTCIVLGSEVAGGSQFHAYLHRLGMWGCRAAIKQHASGFAAKHHALIDMHECSTINGLF
jgi:hypothetical protein